MDAIHRSVRLGGLLLVLVVMIGYSGRTVRAAEPQPGTWQPHKMTLYFLGIGSYYSCDGLKNALTYLLRQAGAKLNAPVVPLPCVNGYDTPERLTQAELNFSALQPAGDTGAGAVPGTWRHVDISSQNVSQELHGTDCELVSEFRQEVLKFFAVRNLKANLNCIPFQDTSLVFGLSFDVFAPVNAPPQVGGNRPLPAQRPLRAAGV